MGRVVTTIKVRRVQENGVAFSAVQRWKKIGLAGVCHGPRLVRRLASEWLSHEQDSPQGSSSIFFLHELQWQYVLQNPNDW